MICKGALDHFDAPDVAIAEMARVTRVGGSVVLAIANFDSLSCRAARALDACREGALGRVRPRGRRPYDVPHDHFTRYELPLMLRHASEHLALEIVEGISLCWGLPAWSRALGRLPETLGQRALAGLDRLARRWPTLSDVVLLAGTPRA